MAKEKTLKDNIYNSILEGIINYEYVPNQIITEKEMVQKYGCSKSPIREALIALCTDGVLRSIPRCGYEIIQLTVDDIRNIQNYRLVLECGMLRFYYNKVTDQQLNRLRQLDQVCNSANDVWSHWKHNTEFHLQLISLSQNIYAYQELNRAMTVLLRAYAQHYRNKWNPIVPPTDTRYHCKLLEALETSDLEMAREALGNDLNDFGEVRLF